MFGAHMLIMQPNDAMMVPAILTFRQPYLFVRTLTSGPVHVFKTLLIIIAVLVNMTGIRLRIELLTETLKTEHDFHLISHIIPKM